METNKKIVKEPFQGQIGRTWQDSKPFSASVSGAPKDAPNILFIVFDDVGYSDFGCYGSEIQTPNINALAKGGIRYSNFHVTSMCSPTRASLLTGRNSHAVGMGSIAEWSTGFPGYEGCISPHAATVAQMLSNFYGTYAVGKWHLANLSDYRTGGSREHWPLGKGFNRWYGFLGGFIDHWNPDLHEDNHPVQREYLKGYHLSNDLVDRSISFIRDHVTSASNRPWLNYLALGAAHWPLHAPKEWISRYHGKYNAGWDEIRIQRLSNQKTMGLVPIETPLSLANPSVRPWDSLMSKERLLCARLQETYAAFISHADEQVGRLVDYLKHTDQLNNTIILLLSDNGASGEGGPTGAVNIRRHISMEKEDIAYGIEQLDNIGNEYTFPHYPMGWAQASNTPLKWFKRNTHGGGIRAPLIVHWPNQITDYSGIRHQYHHVSDIVPTLLDVLDIKAPLVYQGKDQMPLHGISMLYTFNESDSPTHKQTQHFEMIGDRAIWHKGWKAVARHFKGENFDTDQWELYNLDQDFSESYDLAESNPDKLNELIELWWKEAERYDVLPLDDRDVERSQLWSRKEMPKHFEFQPGMARLDRQMVPPISDRSWLIRTQLQDIGQNAKGIILACGSRFAGYQLHCGGGFVSFIYVVHETLSHSLMGKLPVGIANIQISFVRTGNRAGRFEMSVNGLMIGSVHVSRTWTIVSGMSGGLTCGFGNIPITDQCIPPAPIHDINVNRVTISVANDSQDDMLDYEAFLRDQ